MNLRRIALFLVIALAASATSAENLPGRPDLNSVKPIAKCDLQPLGQRQERAPMLLSGGVDSTVPTVEDPLDNYERTELGNWRMPAEEEPGDPWIRLLILGPKRPMVIDVAVFVDGKPFREAREAWIDDLLATGVGGSAPVEKPTAPASSETTDAKALGSALGASRPAVAEASDDPNEDRPAESLPTVANQSRRAPTIRERLANYVAASSSNIDREEIRWLIAEWGSGPGLIVLGPALSWQHAGVAMLEALLDADADGALSAEEMARADETLQQADLDGNDVVDASELRRSAKQEATIPYAIGHSLVVLVDAHTDWEQLSAIVAHVYAGSDGESLSSITSGDKLRELRLASADLSLRIDFDSAEKPSGGLFVLKVSEEIAEAKEAVHATENVISVAFGSDDLEISASSGGGAAIAGNAEVQIAVGAVMEPNPLMRLLDRDQDQRLTVRERQELTEMFAALDRNADGMLAAAEMPAPIRLGITLGPHVHTLLARPSGAARAMAPPDDAAAPEWFASMDKNGDRDLSRDEFLGTTEQFIKFDSDSDGLLNVSEALKLNVGQ